MCEVILVKVQSVTVKLLIVFHNDHTMQETSHGCTGTHPQ